MIRSIGFVVTSMVVGFLSGIFAPHLFGVRGAIFGGALAGGVLACDAYRKKKGALPDKVVLAVAVAVSLGASLLMCGWGKVARLCFPDIITYNLSQTTWLSALTCFLISFGVLLYFQTPLPRYFWGMPLLSVFPRAIAIGAGMLEGELAILFLAIALSGVIGLLSFLLLWGGVARLFGFLRKEPGNARDCTVAGREEA